MAKHNIFDVILRTIDDVKRNNQQNPNEETAHPNVFDLLKGKLGELDQKIKNKRIAKGKKPVSILDMIRNQIDAARNQNQEDPDTPTAPGSIFDKLKDKLNQTQRMKNLDDIQRIAGDYNLDINRLHPNVLAQIEERYDQESRKMDQQFAQAIHNMIAQTN